MEMLGFILVAFLGFIGQVAAFGGVLGVDIQLDVNTPFAANTANGSCKYPASFVQSTSLEQIEDVRLWTTTHA